MSKHIEGVCFFWQTKAKICLQMGATTFKKKEFLAPIRYTLLLDDVSGVRLHDVTKEFLMDYYYLG